MIFQCLYISAKCWQIQKKLAVQESKNSTQNKQPTFTLSYYLTWAIKCLNLSNIAVFDRTGRNTSYVFFIQPCTKQHKLQDRDDRAKNLTGGVIVACPRAGAGLYNFILPLRAYHQPKCYLKPLIILLNER